MAHKRYAVILAAGEGTRMKSKLYKVLHPVCGKSMIRHVVDQTVQLGTDRVVTVVGRGADAVRAELGDSVEYAMQEQQLGTAHAVMQAESLLGAENGITVVLYGDTPLITKNTIEALIDNHEKNGAKATILSSIVENPNGYGRVVRLEDGTFDRVVEDKDATVKEKEIREINTGLYCFDNQFLFKALKQVDNDNVQSEYYLPDVIAILRKEGASVQAYCTEDYAETLGVNDRVQLAQAESIMKNRINEYHMRNGITMIDPNSTYISSDAKIGTDTVIHPGTFIFGKTVIGSNCEIGPHTEIQDTTIEDQTVVKQSVVHDSHVGQGVKIGPFSHIRPSSEIHDMAKIGNFVEIKKSRIGKGSKASHLGYIGDAEVGENVNFSCGAITVNYDGTNKHLTTVGDGAFIGCNVNLIAPVTIERKAFVAAGSTITDPVPEEALAIARSRQTTKENYLRKSNQRKGK